MEKTKRNMRNTLFAIAALGALALTACSSDDGSDATPGNESPTPQATTPDANPGGAGSSFCDFINSSEAMSHDLDTTSDDLTAILDDQENWDSPEAVAALHTYGQAMIEDSNKMVAFYRQAAREANDPAVSQAFATLSNFTELMYKGMGQAAIEADSVMDYQMSWMMNLDQSELQNLSNDLSEAGPLISNYIFETCGYSVFEDISDF